LQGFDAILVPLARRIPDHVTLWELRLAICQGFDQYANVRRRACCRALKGLYGLIWASRLIGDRARKQRRRICRRGRARAHRGLPIEVAMDVAVHARRCGGGNLPPRREVATARPRKHLTVVTKSNAQRHGMVNVALEVCASCAIPRADGRENVGNAMTARMVMKPGSAHTVVATNLHADILSDLASALAGSLGIGATGDIDPSRKNPSRFEPIHGSAFDITGKGIANPLGSFWSSLHDAGTFGRGTGSRAIDARHRNGDAGGATRLTLILGGKATTDQVTAAIINAIRGINV
jgi:tartrate dehydrogenase/decarboxylase/D-malate dehydrogenase